MAKALLLVGPVGSGKTTTLHEIEAILDARGTPNAIVDLDWLAWASPPDGGGVTVHDLLVRNLEAVWRTFHEAGIRHIALARGLHDAGEVASVRAALHGCETTVIDFTGSGDVLRERIRRRDTGVELEEHLAMLDAYEAIERDVRADAIIAIDDRSPGELARDVLGAAGW